MSDEQTNKTSDDRIREIAKMASDEIHRNAAEDATVSVGAIWAEVVEELIDIHRDLITAKDAEIERLTQYAKWACEHCGAVYAEYINGCPSCATGEPGGSHKVVRVHTAVQSLALRIAELERQWEGRSPTPEAYEAACAAIEKHRARAESAESTVERLTRERDEYQAAMVEARRKAEARLDRLQDRSVEVYGRRETLAEALGIDTTKGPWWDASDEAKDEQIDAAVASLRRELEDKDAVIEKLARVRHELMGSLKVACNDRHEANVIALNVREERDDYKARAERAESTVASLRRELDALKNGIRLDRLDAHDAGSYRIAYLDTGDVAALASMKGVK